MDRGRLSGDGHTATCWTWRAFPSAGAGWTLGEGWRLQEVGRGQYGTLVCTTGACQDGVSPTQGVDGGGEAISQEVGIETVTRGGGQGRRGGGGARGQGANSGHQTDTKRDIRLLQV